MGVLNLNNDKIDKVYLGNQILCKSGWESNDVLQPDILEKVYQEIDELKEVWSFTGHTNSVLAVAVDSEGNVYSGGKDKTVRKINKDGREVWSFTGHTGYVRAVAVDSEGNVYSGSHDKTVRKISQKTKTFIGYKILRNKGE